MQAQSAAYLLTLASSLEAAGDADKALAVLDLALAGETGATDALALKGDLLRSRGELQRAGDVFDQLCRRSDDPRARYLAALLGGMPAVIPDLRPAPWPSAFVRLENFLDPAHHHEMLALMTSGAEAFEPSTVGADGVNGREPRVVLTSRISHRLVAIEGVRQWMRPLIEECLQSIATRLGVAPFVTASIDIKCTVYGDQCFFKTHSDSISFPTRRISFVYYFHHQPKRYSGGGLLLYDGDTADPSTHCHTRSTRLDPIDNSIVFFPSGTFHEVTRVVSPSGRLEDGRFTLAGHVITVAGDAAPPDRPGGRDQAAVKRSLQAPGFRRRASSAA